MVDKGRRQNADDQPKQDRQVQGLPDELTVAPVNRRLAPEIDNMK